MPVYEYHPDELARLSVLRRANGLDLEQVRERGQGAQERVRLAHIAPAEPRNPSELGIASCQSLEWARIAHVMAEQQMPIYSPDQDPRVARREEQRSHRMATEAASEEPGSAGLPVEVLRCRVYRITGGTANSPAGEQPLIRHIFAASGAAAFDQARAMFSRPGSTHHEGEYRITSVEQVLPEPGEFP
ncbi:hypothetical protein OHU17_38050 (plasmid) [Streptomyces goshikiensis]|uniref:Uncharacterized protein n=2 Tax=Streptomyces TaxID=1883 RepID=A0ABZ1RYE3_9ACTN|nr:hypothetical protein [Streptomyces goshikiensis]